MAQQNIINSSKLFGAPVMTLDSRDKQKKAGLLSSTLLVVPQKYGSYENVWHIICSFYATSHADEQLLTTLFLL